MIANWQMKNAEDAEQETIFIAGLFVLLIHQDLQSSQESRKMVMHITAPLHYDSLFWWQGMNVEFASHAASISSF
ncbi:hypothetical protein SADUNF_Sadunf12G0031800 [Salix dunnii]|uniref:Uncharacterized protein n=1 Tax=Salix dunnii TaxID=1413687 RepID=A0A835MVP2_9ROSI|nr:hypothetical protein SADUNF_Sadunf12G0031800 [Salix dunnii]